MKKLHGKVALVTGGTRGIGLAIASRLAEEGAAVHVTGRSKIAPLSKEFAYFSVDFTNESDVKTFLADIENKKIDILVNNAGINKVNGFTEISMSDFKDIQQVNTHVPFQLCQAVVPYMKKMGWGRIVNIASIWSKLSTSGRASYSASKFAIDGITSAISAEFAPFGILANCVSPGFIETDLTKEILGADGMKEIANQVPIKRLGQPKEIAELVVWLVSNENSYISGQNIVIDGGFTRV